MPAAQRNVDVDTQANAQDARDDYGEARTNLDHPVIESESDITERTVEDELLDVLSRQAMRVPIPVLVLDSILAAYASRHLAAAYWATWLGLVVAMQIIRVLVLTRLPSMTHLPHRRRLQIATALSAVNGAVHALSFYAFPLLTDFERAVQTMLLGGLAAGTVVSAAGYRPVYLAFSMPIFVPLFILWAINAGGTDNGWENRVFAVLVVMFAAVMYSNARDSYKLFRDSFTIRLEQARLNKKLSLALRDADAANKAKTRFLASASHDLRQPLHTLSLFSATLQNRLTDRRSREIADHMKLALEALGSQLDALLDISRLDAGVVKADFAPVRLATMLERICNEFRPEAREKNLGLDFSCPPDALVQTDQALLQRIIVNLLSNAIKYTDSGGISVIGRIGAEDIRLRIQDSGKGIPSHLKARVFEEFYQIDNPHRDRKEGFGLGLSIVKRMVGLLNIDISVESEVDRGTTFELTMPRATQSKVATGHVTQPCASLTGLRVLVVDDEAEVRLGMQSFLESLGCRVTLTDGTAQALSAAGERKPDIMLFDFRLRDGEDGLTTLSAVRTLHADLPAIMISGDTAPDRLREANEAGVELLHKPVTEEKLRAAIAVACNARQAATVSPRPSETLPLP